MRKKSIASRSAQPVPSSWRPVIANCDVDAYSAEEAFDGAARMLRAAQTFIIGTGHTGSQLDVEDMEIVSDLILGATTTSSGRRCSQ